MFQKYFTMNKMKEKKKKKKELKKKKKKKKKKKNSQVEISENLNNLLNPPACKKSVSSTLVGELIYKE